MTEDVTTWPEADLKTAKWTLNGIVKIRTRDQTAS